MKKDSARFSKEQQQALAGQTPMTLRLFAECLFICECADDYKQYFRIRKQFPAMADRFSFLVYEYIRFCAQESREDRYYKE